MTTLHRFDETEITITDDIIKIHQQSRNYSTATIEIPVSMWANFAHAVEKEIDNFSLEEKPNDLASEAFQMMNAMNLARAEEIKHV